MHYDAALFAHYENDTPLPARLTVIAPRHHVNRRRILGLTQIPCKFGSCGCHDSGLEQIDFGAPIHLSFDGFQAVDLALDLAAGPRR